MGAVRIGLKKFHYALLTSDSESTLEYATPVKVPGVISITVTPNTSTETLFADDQSFESAAALGAIQVEINQADLDLATQAALLGHTVTAGIIKKKADATAPLVAIGFESLKSNGKKRFVWLTKGRFAEPEMASETKGDAVKFQTPSLSGAFVAREKDGIWKIIGDEDAAGWVAPVGGWYTADVLEA